MAKIGVGVTTNGGFWDGVSLLPADVWNFSHNNDQISIAHDKNEIIKRCFDDGCEYIFLFDDDTFPVREGWADFFINAHKKTGIDHFVLCKPNHNTLIEKQPIVSLYATGTGCMVFLTRQVVERVGYMNPEYGKYGYEHAGYSHRIHRAGFTPSWYVSVNGWEKYIYSWDLDKRDDFERTHWDGEENKADYIALNEDVFRKELASYQLYYPYDLELSK